MKIGCWVSFDRDSARSRELTKVNYNPLVPQRWEKIYIGCKCDISVLGLLSACLKKTETFGAIGACLRGFAKPCQHTGKQ